MAAGHGFGALAREELNRRILDVMPGGLVHVAANGAILSANAEALRILGLSFDELSQRYTQDFETETIWEDGSPCPASEYPVSKALATGHPQSPVTIGVRRPDGSVAWAVFAAVPIHDPKTLAVTSAVVTFLDITARKAAEEALRESEAKLRSIFESAPNPIVLADREGTVLFINRAGPGVRTEDVIGSPAWKFVAPEDQATVRDCMERVIRTGQPDSYEIRAGAVGGSYAVSVGPVRVGERVVGTTFIAFETTELRDLQARVAVTDRLASLGTLAAGVAHEINNPLTYMMANMQWVQRYLEERPDGEQARGWIRDALEGVHRIRDIVSDLRSLTVEREGALASADVREVLETTIRMSQSELRHRARVTKRFADDIPRVAAPGSRLGQVFLNLLINAAQAIPEGDFEHNEVSITVSATASRVVVEVADTGVGIEPQLLGRVFDPFVTTKRPEAGTGLGLYISRNVVTSLGGDISVSSGPGRGAVFRVELPIAESPEGAPRGAGSAPPGAAKAEKKLRVLVVDDEQAITGVLRSHLRDHDVAVANSGREAIRLLCDRQFDVVLCDLVMPDQTGMDVYEHVRKQGRGHERHIVFMTGGAFTDRAREFLGTVSNPVLEKPFTERDIVAAVSRVCTA